MPKIEGNLSVIKTSYEAQTLSKALESLLDKYSPTDVLRLLDEQVKYVGALK